MHPTLIDLGLRRAGYTIEAGFGDNPLPLDQMPELVRDNLPIFLLGLSGGDPDFREEPPEPARSDLPEYRDQTDPLPQPTMPKYGEIEPPTGQIESAPKSSVPPEEIAPADGTLVEQMEAFERALLQRAVEAASGNLVAAASALGISRATIYNKVRKYGIMI